MWEILSSVQVTLQCLSPALTAPSFQTLLSLFIGWAMCLGHHNEFRVFQTILAETEVTGAKRHPFDRFYNFFSRSKWQAKSLFHLLALEVVKKLKSVGEIHLAVDETLLHKRGVHVWGMGWFRDGSASTRKRVVTASGNHWVVMGLVIAIPFCPNHKIFLALHARLHLPGKNQPTPAELAKEMLLNFLEWFPDRKFVVIGDGAYATKKLLENLDPRVHYIGRMRGDAALYEPLQPEETQGNAKKGKGKGQKKRGPKPKKGPRTLSPKEAARRADKNRTGQGPWVWTTIKATLYGKQCTRQVLSYVALWPAVLGLRPVRIFVIRDVAGKMDDLYLFTTNLAADAVWALETFAERWSIEVAFKGSKQVLDIEGPQHWCRNSIEKLAPWVWLMQTVVILWYLTAGHDLPEAEQARKQMGPWDCEWSLRHMLNVLRRATMEATIQKMKGRGLMRIVQMFRNCLQFML